MQDVIWAVTIIVMGAIGFGFLAVALGAGERLDYGAVQPRAYRFRAKLFWSVIAAGIVVAFFTLRELPYAGAGDGAAPQVVNATGYQWYWEIDKTTVVSGRPVEFRITSADVNHGFGIYDSDYRLRAQVQAMPGYINRLRHTFVTPGVYRFLCLEYCGPAHHAMLGEIEVKAP